MIMRMASSRLTFKSGPMKGERFAVKKGVKVGRGPENDVTLEDKQLSRIHCCFYTQGSTTYVADLDSTNGTRVNGETVLIRRPLLDGDVIQVGASEIHYSE